MIESVLIPYITALPAINAALGSRIYPGKGPDAPERPYCVYFLAAASTEHTHDSPAFRTWRFQFSIFAGTYSAVASIRDALIDALDGYKGKLTAGSESADITSFLTSCVHFFESETRLHHCAVDFEITQSV